MIKRVFLISLFFSIFFSLANVVKNKNNLYLKSNALQLDYQTTKMNLYPPQLFRVANLVEHKSIFKYYFYFEKNITDIFDLREYSNSWLSLILFGLFALGVFRIFIVSPHFLGLLVIFPTISLTLVGPSPQKTLFCFLPTLFFGFVLLVSPQRWLKK